MTRTTIQKSFLFFLFFINIFPVNLSLQQIFSTRAPYFFELAHKKKLCNFFEHCSTKSYVIGTGPGFKLEIQHPFANSVFIN